MQGRLHRADIVVTRGNEYWIYEAKADPKIRYCIRQALGQLLEYSFWPGNQEAAKLVIVGEVALGSEAAQYLARLRKLFLLPVEYQQFDLATGKFVVAKS
jgi:hypothetical protein